MKIYSNRNRLAIVLLAFGIALAYSTLAMAQRQYWKPKGTGVPVFALAFSPDGKTLTAAGGNGDVKLWDATAGRLQHTLQGNWGPVTAIAFTPDNKQLVISGRWDKQINIWSTTAGTIERTFQSDDSILTLAFVELDQR